MHITDVLEAEVGSLFFSVYGQSIWVMQGYACFAGHSWQTPHQDGHYAPVGLRLVDGKIAPTLLLPLDHPHPPTQSVGIYSDSTVHNFRSVIHTALRQHQCDLRQWSVRGGACEDQVVASLDRSPPVDIALVFPNGNKLAKHREQHESGWICELVKKLVASAKGTARRACVYVGSEHMWPSAPAAYGPLVGHYHRRLQGAGLALVVDAPGMVFELDGMHWAQGSDSAVQQLIHRMVDNTTKTQGLVGPEPKDWEVQDGYLWCIRCSKWMDLQHLNGNQHMQNMSGRAISPPLTQEALDYLQGITKKVGGQEGVHQSRNWAMVFDPTLAALLPQMLALQQEHRRHHQT